MISLILALALIGVVLYLIEQLPMDGAIRMVIRILVLLFVILLLVRALGLDVALPRLLS